MSALRAGMGLLGASIEYHKREKKDIRLFTRICGRTPVPGVRQAGDISTLLQF